MASGRSAIPQALILPNPPDKYDSADERETRRIIMEAMRRLLNWGAVTNVPHNVDGLANLGAVPDGLPYFGVSSEFAITTLTAFGRSLIAVLNAGAGRTLLGMQFLAQRADTVLTTASLADTVEESGSLALTTKSGALLQVVADRACRVRLYSTQAARDADLTRLVTVKGTPGTGLLAEFVFTGAGTVPVSPVATLTNDETVPVARVWYNVQNKSGGTHTVAVTLTVLPLEI